MLFNIKTLDEVLPFRIDELSSYLNKHVGNVEFKVHNRDYIAFNVYSLADLERILLRLSLKVKYKGILDLENFAIIVELKKEN